MRPDYSPIFVLGASKEWTPRLSVCIDSIVEHMPEARIEIIPYRSIKPGEAYIKDMYALWYGKLLELLKNGEQHVLGFGTDCILHERIPEDFWFDAEYNLASVIMTPHVVHPPEDNSEYYLTGHINSSVLGVTPGAIPILEWMSTQEMSTDQKDSGSFYDQSVLSSLPFLFDRIKIDRDPSLNVAWYNSEEREILGGPGLGKNDKFFVKTGDVIQPLKVAHFSGYIPGSPERASKHSGKIHKADSGWYRLNCQYEGRLREAGQERE